MPRSNMLLNAVAALALSGFHADAQGTRDRSNVASVRTGDPAMEEAKRKARATLPEFFKTAQAPKPSTKNFALKIGVPVGSELEFVWIRPFEKKRGRYSGQLRNDMIGRSLKFGDTVTFAESDIADWSYLDDGKMKGNFTTCAIFKNKPQHEMDAFKKQYGLECEF